MNEGLSNKTSQGSTKWIRLVPYGILGGVIFALNSNLELNYIVKGYLVLLEAQAGIVILYFLFTKVLKNSKKTLNVRE